MVWKQILIVKSLFTATCIPINIFKVLKNSLIWCELSLAPLAECIMARDWRNQYYFRSWSQFQQIFWLLSSDKVTLTSCNSAEPSQGVFSLNGQKQQQTCFLFLRILNKKWGRDALWKLEKRNFDVHHFIRHFIFLCWIITVKCLRVVVLSVSMFCVCTKRGRALPPPIVTHHPAWHAEIQIIWPGAHWG